MIISQVPNYQQKYKISIGYNTSSEKNNLIKIDRNDWTTDGPEIAKPSIF